MAAEVPEEATYSAVLALIPEAEPVVRTHRSRLDPTVHVGVPAHVTVLSPFVPPKTIDAATIDALRSAVKCVPVFSCQFDAVRWFGEDLMWLAPVPSTPFVDLTDRVWRSFPEHAPYEGNYEPRPHLTVGYRSHSSLDALRAAAAEIEPTLPFTAHVDRLHLLAGTFTPDSWRVIAELPLGD